MIATIKWGLIAILTLILLWFAIVNRQVVDFSLFPLPYEISLPAFLFAVLFFLLGFATASLAALCKRIAKSSEMRKQTQRIDALENEVKGLRNTTPTSTT